MAPVTRGPFGRLTSGMQLVSRNAPHFRTGRWFLLAEGVVLTVVGVWGFASAATHPHTGPAGAPVLILALTPWHSGLLLGIGLAAMLAALQRFAAVLITAAAAVVFLLLVFLGAIAATHHAPGPLGFDNGDIVLHGVLAATNFAALYWLIPDVLEGPNWVRRRTPRELPPEDRPRPRHEPAPAPGRPHSAPPTGHRTLATAATTTEEHTHMTQPATRPIVVITGGTAGIGRATVREFADAGYDVAILARGQAGLDGAAAEVEAAGGRCLGVSVDVADDGAVDAAARRVESEFGPIDVWVNVAFVGSLAYFWDTTPEEFRRMTEVTYFGQVNGMRAALLHMRPRDRGAIVNVSSAMAYRSIPLQSAYCGAKAAVRGVTESLITELRATGSKVTIGLVTLPGVNTTQFNWNLSKMARHPMPVPPIVEPEVCARAIRFSAEHPRRNMWVGIATAYTVLGNRVAPSFVDWYLGKTGVTSQQTTRDLPRWGSNVFEPRDAEHDRGARGEFSAMAATRDPVSFVARNRVASLAAGAAVLAAAGLMSRVVRAPAT